MLNLTRDLCAIIDKTNSASLTSECMERVKQAIADGVAVALAGCREAPVAIGAAHAQSVGGAQQASVWGWDFKASVVQAACVNAMAMHVLDFEPMWSPPTHAVSPAVPVAFALAELYGATGEQIVTAVAKGLEIQCRLQYAGDQYVPEKLRFHPPGVAGVFGSAVVASSLLGLDTSQLQYALGIAASRAGTLLANVGSMTKCLHCGNAAASGLDSALLAQRGFTSNPDVLEAHKGVIATYYPDGFDAARLLAYGKPFRVVDPGFAIKMFPSQYGTHYVITAALEVHGKIADPSRIASVRIVSPVMKYVNRPCPATGLDGKFSLQYLAAAALLDGKVKIDTFTDERRFRSDMEALLGKITLVQDESIPGDFHHMHVDVEVELDDGARVKAVCRAPRGSWGVPLAPGEHRGKLEDCLARALPAAQLEQLIAQLERLEQLDAKGVAGIVALMARAGPAR
ncbi:MAG TPA: MmgE/PrpD family protein [Burkholderiales bacterium]|nr:MmgE/PrpD family protein [Burkholderiales bacterium]